ncbi:CpXC domain-containing protein [Candidatus Chlorohelix sp.]|uniref:CpXC domain-containing protein n=1 Tax=Candidatus Chlorohelix sp. TaxID=3139201 RepID=UPI0030446A4E
MAVKAICRFNCGTCETELEQDGVIYFDALDTELTAKLLVHEINRETCPNCMADNILPLPLVFHDGKRQLLVAYVPGVAQMSQEDIADALRLPYETAITDIAKRMGIEFPEPDAAASPPSEEEPYTRFSALTQEQAAELLPEYLLRPTVVSSLDVVIAMVQAVQEGMGTQEILEDMARLQLINALIETRDDPITRRKVLRLNEPYLDEELLEVIDTLSEQMVEEGNTELGEKLQLVRYEILRYKNVQETKAKKAKSKEKAE